MKPDLIVITGDIVDPAQSANFESMYKNAMELIKNSGIPWVWTGGSQIDGLTREQVLRIDQEYSFENSWSGYKWDLFEKHSIYTEEQLGWFTARIPIMDPFGNELLSVYTFDSEAWQCADGLNMPGYNCISSDAISWFTSQEIEWSHKREHRDILFTHRPLQEFMQMANNYSVYGIRQQAVGC